MISSAINLVPFSLNNANHRVIVDEPLQATGLDYTQIYNKYEPVHSSSISANIVEWATGEKVKGIQTVEEGLLEGTTLTAVGKVTLRNGLFKIKVPENHEYILSKMTLKGIIQEKTSSTRTWKYVTFGFTIVGGAFMLIWLFRRRQWLSRLYTNTRTNRPAFPEDDRNYEFGENAQEMYCVICLTNRRNVVILNCGHVCVCRSCASQIDSCPICRGVIERLVPIYQS